MMGQQQMSGLDQIGEIISQKAFGRSLRLQRAPQVLQGNRQPVRDVNPDPRLPPATPADPMAPVQPTTGLPPPVSPIPAATGGGFAGQGLRGGMRPFGAGGNADVRNSPPDTADVAFGNGNFVGALGDAMSIAMGGVPFGSLVEGAIEGRNFAEPGPLTGFGRALQSAWQSVFGTTPATPSSSLSGGLRPGQTPRGAGTGGRGGGMAGGGGQTPKGGGTGTKSGGQTPKGAGQKG